MLKLFFILIVIINISNELKFVYNNKVKNYFNQELHENIARISYINKNEEIPRKFLQEYNSLNPVMLLVDDTEISRQNAANFINNLFKLNPRTENINFMLMRFNSSGVTSIQETTKNNKIRFKDLLNNKHTIQTTSFLGQHNNFNKTAVFFGILNAAHILPLNSGILIFISRGIEDENLAQHALIEAKKKNIRVFVIWGDEYSSMKNNEEQLLKDITKYSSGNFFINSNKNVSSQNFLQYLNNINNYQSMSIILSRKKLMNENNLFFPIDFDVTGIHISIQSNFTTGILTTPSGKKIDILNSEDVENYSDGSFTLYDTNIYDIHLNITTAKAQDVGIWRLRINNNAHAPYAITIFVHTNLTTNANIIFNNRTDFNKTFVDQEKIMKLGVTGDISLISNISFVNKDGQIILDNVNFTLDKDWEKYLTENINDNAIKQKKELNLDVEMIPNEPFYAKITGKDAKGYKFTRLSYVRSNIYRGNTIFQLPSLTIDVGIGSELITQPNRQSEIFFEVTNNGNTATLVRFYCKDEKYILLSMNPWYKWLSPQETTTVRVTLTTRPGAYQDVITFIAQGNDVTEKRVIVDVGTSQINDDDEPDIDYQYTSDCTDYLFSKCQEGTWAIKVTAKDSESGLLQLTTIPKGILIENGFTTGTKEDVTGHFTESCCNPDLQLIAIDRQNNRRIRNVNAYRANLGPGAIAAIVLGILLLIIFIIAIVFCIRYLVKGRKSYDFPTYRGPTNSSRRI